MTEQPQHPCVAGHKYHAGIEGWTHDDEETA